MSDAARRTARTVIQTLVALALALPGIVDASGIPASLPWVVGALAVAAGLARVMALPAVDALLPVWLRTAAPTPTVPTSTPPVPAPPASDAPPGGLTP